MSLVFALLSASAPAATITGQTGSSGEPFLLIELNGSINSSDENQVHTLLSKYPKHAVGVNLSSIGGDVDSSISIGRLLRAREASITVTDECLSSCVLIYASGVERMNIAQAASELGNRSILSTGIGIHRLYFSNISPDSTMIQISTARNRLKERVGKYLSEMNVSLQLLDAMEAVPPEEIRILQLTELRQFGLGKIDPALDEKRVAQQAATYNLTSAEFRRRSAAARSHCVQFPPGTNCIKRPSVCKVDLNLLALCEDNFIRAGIR